LFLEMSLDRLWIVITREFRTRFKAGADATAV
jgi:hypothetical protein